jgi:hypothetical protein
MHPDAITLEVRALEALDLEGVRAAWRARYGAPPKLRSVELLKRLLAWRIQAAAFGGLDTQTRRKLRSAGSTQERGLAPGMKVAREWKGVRYEATVLADGFSYQGHVYESLSAIARKITGSRWNGPRFFGLRSASGEG